MLKKEFKQSKKILKASLKENKTAYKAARDPLKLRIIKKVKYYIKIIKIVYKTLFHAYLRILELKKELDAAYEKIKNLEIDV